MSSPHRDFESIKKIDDHGNEYWFARELMPLLEYTKWQNFEPVIEKAIEASKNSGQSTHYHFTDVSKMIKVATGTVKETLRKVKDYKLSRYACYLIAQNGDSKKEAVSLAQTYFAIQARKQEILEKLGEEEKRLFIRQEVTTQNKQLFSTAKNVGVKNFGRFNEAGYEGLYGMSSQKVKQKKGIGKDNLLDRTGATELAANLFRITQTDEKIKKKNIKGEGSATLTHRGVGMQVRDAMQKISGILPENLPAETNIKNIEKKKKQGILDQPNLIEFDKKE